LEELNQEIEGFNSLVSAEKPEAKITTRDQKIDYLKKEMIRRVLLYQDALIKRLDKKEEVIQALEKTRQDLLVMELVKQETGGMEVSSKEIEDYYNTYKEELKEPEQRQVLEIAVPNEQEAKEILIQLLQGGDFATLARERSKAASAKSGGNLGFIQKGQKSAQFDEVAFSDALEVGKTSNIFKGPDGLYYILKLEAKSGGKQKSLSDLWDDIKRGLLFLKQQKKLDDLIGKLSREAKIEVFEGEIK
jgi:parvulin-like peptidyl-prolyl isomerase